MAAPNPPNRDTLANSAGFRQLLGAKSAFLVPASVFFVVYYFALPVMVGYFPELMKKPVWGKVNAAYLFALSQFFVAWALAFIYLRKAARWDRQAAQLIEPHIDN
jgi:uncharacterized membrane protein (DUF485 family)